MLPIVLAAALGSAIVTGFVVWSISRARARALADDVASCVEPYLRRKASEAGLELAQTPWTSRHQPEEIVTYSAELAQKLLGKDRVGGLDEAMRDRTPELREMALADTQQLASDKLVATAPNASTVSAAETTGKITNKKA